jgi:crotonobetainyl-CoA:carnitine CoA-transferase CaiB-like acyl-CoA transferase
MFKNLKVLELASVLAGPGVGQFFAELGAEVIKVESLKTNGDVTRTWKSSGEETDDRSAYFCSVNWGKKSLAIDLETAEGKQTIYKLIKGTDIVIASYKPGDAKKLGVDYETLSAINSSLIYGQITGYGSQNPRVGYDAVIQAEAGFMFMNGEPDGPSLKMPVALIDVLAGHQLKEAILIAMLERTHTGIGKMVEVSLIQTALASLANQSSNWLVAHKLPQKHGSAHPNIAPYGDVFKTKDDVEILLAIGTDRQFQDLCQVLKSAALLENPLFSTNQNRVKNRELLKLGLILCFENFVSTDLLPELHARNIPAGTIQNIKQAFELPEAKDILMSSGNIIGIQTFIARSQSWENQRAILPPPHFGQHNNDIIENLTTDV